MKTSEPLTKFESKQNFAAIKSIENDSRAMLFLPFRRHRSSHIDSENRTIQNNTSIAKRSLNEVEKEIKDTKSRHRIFGRPPASTEDKRGVKIAVFLTEAEAETMREKAKGANISPPEFLRHTGLSKKIEARKIDLRRPGFGNTARRRAEYKSVGAGTVTSQKRKFVI